MRGWTLDRLIDVVRTARKAGASIPDVIVIPAEDWARLTLLAGPAPDGIWTLERFSTERDGRKIEHVDVENFTVFGVPVVAEGSLPGIGLTEVPLSVR